MKRAFERFSRYMADDGGYLRLVIVLGLLPVCILAGAVDCVRDDWWPEVRRKWRLR